MMLEEDSSQLPVWESGLIYNKLESEQPLSDIAVMMDS